MKYVLLVTLFLGSVCSAQTLSANACSRYNIDYGPFTHINHNANGHIKLEHSYLANIAGQCVYSNPTSGRNCTTFARATPGLTSPGENGTLNTLGYHVAGQKQQEGQASGNGVALSTTGYNKVAFALCLNSDCQVSITSPLLGIGNPAGTIWEDAQDYTTSCAAKVAVVVGGVVPPKGGSGGGSCSGGLVGGNLTPGELPPTDNPCNVSPVVISTKHGEFKFSNPDMHCVTFDLRADGKPDCYSWPTPNSGVGFLVLDRDGDGVIENGAELFGDHTPQINHPNPNNPNGFLALAEYDLPQFGGNGDTVIDDQDNVWPHLKIWIDEHCYEDPGRVCVSRKSELHDLKEFGIESIDLEYGPGNKTDRWGNDFRFSTNLNADKDDPATDNLEHLPPGHKHRYHYQRSKDGRKAYDVFLVMKQK